MVFIYVVNLCRSPIDVCLKVTVSDLSVEIGSMSTGWLEPKQMFKLECSHEGKPPSVGLCEYRVIVNHEGQQLLANHANRGLFSLDDIFSQSKEPRSAKLGLWGNSTVTLVCRPDAARMPRPPEAETDTPGASTPSFLVEPVELLLGGESLLMYARPLLYVTRDSLMEVFADVSDTAIAMSDVATADSTAPAADALAKQSKASKQPSNKDKDKSAVPYTLHFALQPGTVIPASRGFDVVAPVMTQLGGPVEPVDVAATLPNPSAASAAPGGSEPTVTVAAPRGSLSTNTAVAIWPLTVRKKVLITGIQSDGSRFAVTPGSAMFESLSSPLSVSAQPSSFSAPSEAVELSALGPSVVMTSFTQPENKLALFALPSPLAYAAKLLAESRQEITAQRTVVCSMFDGGSKVGQQSVCMPLTYNGFIYFVDRRSAAWQQEAPVIALELEWHQGDYTTLLVANSDASLPCDSASCEEACPDTGKKQLQTIKSTLWPVMFRDLSSSFGYWRLVVTTGCVAPATETQTQLLGTDVGAEGAECEGGKTAVEEPALIFLLNPRNACAKGFGIFTQQPKDNILVISLTQDTPAVPQASSGLLSKLAFWKSKPADPKGQDKKKGKEDSGTRGATADHEELPISNEEISLDDSEVGADGHVSEKVQSCDAGGVVGAEVPQPPALEKSLRLGLMRAEFTTSSQRDSWPVEPMATYIRAGNLFRSLVGVLDGVPVLGLAKAVVHQVLNQKVAAQRAAIKGALSTALTAALLPVALVAAPAAVAAASTSAAISAASSTAIATSITAGAQAFGQVAGTFLESSITMTQSPEEANMGAAERVMRATENVPIVGHAVAAGHYLRGDMTGAKRAALKSTIGTATTGVSAGVSAGSTRLFQGNIGGTMAGKFGSSHLTGVVDVAGKAAADGTSERTGDFSNPFISSAPRRLATNAAKAGEEQKQQPLPEDLRDFLTDFQDELSRPADDAE